MSEILEPELTDAIANAATIASIEKAKAKKKQALFSVLIGLGSTIGLLLLLTVFVKFTIPPEKALIGVYLPAGTEEEEVSETKPVVMPPPVEELPVFTEATDVNIQVDSVEFDIPDIEVEDIEATEQEFTVAEDSFEGLDLGDLETGVQDLFAMPRPPESVVFVIDYSLSMKSAGKKGGEKKIDLAKKELAKAIKKLANGTKYQIIFFGGPYWLAEDTVTVDKDRFVSTRTDSKGNKFTRKNDLTWLNKHGKPTPIKLDYIEASNTTLAKSVEQVIAHPMSLGTKWKAPIELGLSLKPEVIYFMSDGASAEKDIEKLGDLAAKQDTVIHAIAFMIAEQHQARMATLSEKSGGLFSIVNADGSHKVQNLDDFK